VAEARSVAAELEREWTALVGPARMAPLREALEALNDALWPPG
jgi:hypothetical protein